MPDNNPDKFSLHSEDIWGETIEKTYKTCSKCCYMGGRDVLTCSICGKIFCIACLKIHQPACFERVKKEKEKENNVKNK